jgi:hypothetical protein
MLDLDANLPALAVQRQVERRAADVQVAQLDRAATPAPVS